MVDLRQEETTDAKKRVMTLEVFEDGTGRLVSEDGLFWLLGREEVAKLFIEKALGDADGVV